MSQQLSISRRDILKGTGSAGLVLGVTFISAKRGFAMTGKVSFEPNAFIRVAPDSLVTIISKHLEIGQGTTTAIAAMIADEMDADWAQIRMEYAPANDALYKNLLFQMQMTGGQSAVMECHEQMRQAGATARAMLVSAAAKEWNVPEADIKVSKGMLSSGSRRAKFGEIAEAASRIPVPEKVTLKSPDQFLYIGKPVERIDAYAKSTGTQTYTIDQKLPGLLTAVVAHPSKFGAVVKSFDASRALQVKGVRQVVRIPEGVAVIATGMWAAIKGRDALEVVWDDGQAENRSSSDIRADFAKKLDMPGAVAKTSGDVEAGFKKAKTTVQTSYDFPYLAHALMEPLNCIAWMHDGKLVLWSAFQMPTLDQMACASATGLKTENIIFHNLSAGGAFGRRGTANADYVLTAINIAKAANLTVPVRYQRTREDDMRAGFYRPCVLHGIKAAVDASGNVCAWSQRVISQSVMTAFVSFNAVKNGIDFTTVEGSATMPYMFENCVVDMHIEQAGPPVQAYRGVGCTHNTFVVETMMDELAAAANKDPYEFRLAYLKENPRFTAVLKMAAEKAGWNTPLPKNHARGIALGSYATTPIAHVVELHLDDGEIKLDRVVAVVDCGQVITPDNVHSQMEGGIMFGLSSAMAELTLDKGVIAQGNYDEYPLARMQHLPKIETYIMPSTEKPIGVGEAVVVPIGPAVANAVSALTGKRFRALPLSKTKLV